MSKTKDGFTNLSEAHDVRNRDREALERMKQLEQKFQKRLKEEVIDGTYIRTTAKKTKDSALVGYVKQQRNERNQLSQIKSETRNIGKTIQQYVAGIE